MAATRLAAVASEGLSILVPDLASGKASLMLYSNYG